VTGRGKETIENDVTLAGRLEPLLGDEIAKCLFLSLFHSAILIESEYHRTYHPCARQVNSLPVL